MIGFDGIENVAQLNQLESKRMVMSGCRPHMREQIRDRRCLIWRQNKSAPARGRRALEVVGERR
ncbi:MAG: hypothetical protein C4334_00385 [Pyrinomonas sp.]